MQTQLVLDVLRREFFISTENKGFRAVREAKLVDEHHLSVSDQANERIFGNKVDRLLEGIL